MKCTVVSPHALYAVHTLMYQYAWSENIDYLIILKIILAVGLLLERGTCLVGGCLVRGVRFIQGNKELLELVGKGKLLMP